MTVLIIAIALVLFLGPLAAFVCMAESVGRAREKRLWNKLAAYGDSPWTGGPGRRGD